MSNYLNNLPVDFPHELIEKGYSLESVGIIEMAWKINDAKDVINYLSSKGYVILGGDVYLENEKGYECTCDNWYFNKSTDKNIVEESKKKALDYITKYSKNNGEKHIYSIIFE